MKWYKSLIFKIILCCLILTFCLVGSIFGVLYRYQQSILSEMETKSSEILEAIQVQVTNLELEDTPQAVLESRFSEMSDLQGVDAVIFYDAQRNVVTSMHADNVPLLEFGPPPYNAYIADVRDPSGRKTTQYLQTFPLMVGNKPVGYVRIWLSIAPQTHLIKALQSKVLISLIMLFLATIGALCYFIAKLLRPLQGMAATCQHIGEGNLQEISIEPNANEVLILEMKFNEMVAALRKKAEIEQKLVQSQRLTALGNLAAGVAHEIGNPLNSIKLTISHLKDVSSKEELDEVTFARYADTILSEVNRLDQIVKDFLTLAKERDLSIHPYRIDKLLNETIRLVEKEAQKRGVSIRSSIPSTVREIAVDAQFLKSATLNVIINAMEASEEGETIDVSLTESNGHVLISVADEGTGIPSEIIDRVFDPYFTTKSVGTGLGLSLTKTIIEKHGGEILIESRDGQGTTVTISLPMEGK